MRIRTRVGVRVRVWLGSIRVRVRMTIWGSWRVKGSC